jgi:hypothetical protein
MNMAAIFALLLSSGVCSESRFAAPDGVVLSVLTCPRMIPAEETPEAPPAKPPKRT